MDDQQPIHLIPKKEFAKMALVSAGAVSQAGKKLGDAVVGKKINILHHNAQAYINERPIRDAKYGLNRGKSSLPDSPQTPIAPVIPTYSAPTIPADIPKPVLPDELAVLTLQEIVERYGSLNSFNSYVLTQKNMEEYRIKNIKAQQSRFQLIEKNSQAKIIFEAFELLSERLLNDIPLSLAKRAVSIAKHSGDDAISKVQKECQGYNSRALKICKDAIIRQLKPSSDYAAGTV